MTAALARLARLAQLKRDRVPIVMVTAYDIVSARAAEAAGVDVVLVGDSAANVVLGYESTQSIGADELLVFARAVRRGLTTPLMVCDLPFGTYEDSDAQAVATARRFTAEARCDAVKIEGAAEIAARARAIVAAGIPVMGHVGLLPQHVDPGGAFHAQGRTADEALGIARAARELERAGCFAIVIEAVPAPVSAAITARLSIPTIGIGAGPGTDGQVLVFHDLLGLTNRRPPKFARTYASLFEPMAQGLRDFAADVRARHYPTAEHSYPLAPDQLAAFRAALAADVRA